MEVGMEGWMDGVREEGPLDDGVRRERKWRTAAEAGGCFSVL